MVALVYAVGHKDAPCHVHRSKLNWLIEGFIFPTGKGLIVSVMRNTKYIWIFMDIFLLIIPLYLLGLGQKKY